MMTETLTKITSRAEHVVARIAEICAGASALGILGIVILLTASSLKRYVLNSPISVTEELGGLMFMATTFLALTWGFVRGRHVRLELLWRVLPPKLAGAFEVIGLVAAVAGLGILAIETWNATLLSYELQGRSVMTELLLWPWRLIMPLTLFLLIAAILLRCVRIARGGFVPPPDEETGPVET